MTAGTGQAMTAMEKAQRKLPRSDASVYRDDFVRWCFEQAEILQRREFTDADLPNLIEELESMGREQRHALRSRYRLVMMHLLKLQFQPGRRTRPWMSTITRERVNIADREGDSKTLRDQAPAIVAEAYRGAVLRASAESGLPPKTFPVDCPYTLDQLRDPDWMPDDQRSEPTENKR